jgi:phage terminase large subunit-like protein
VSKEVTKKTNGDVFDTKRVVQTLESLMSRVTEKDCTAETVNAACNCADRITQILRLHLDVHRLRAKASGGKVIDV